MIVYEYPFHESIRTWLRLERLFMRFSALLFREHAIDHHHAISTLFEIADLCASTDPKMEVINELQRQKKLLGTQQHTIHDAELQQQMVAMQEALLHSFHTLISVAGKPGQTLLEDSLLKSLKGRFDIAGGAFEFDRATYHAWLHKDAPQRQRELARWFTGSFQPLAEGIQLILERIRSTGGSPQRVIASKGYYEQSLPATPGWQLLRLYMPDDTNLAAEVQGSKLGFNVRIMQRNPDGNFQPCPHHIALDVVLCH